jgi:hypothetical protein
MINIYKLYSITNPSLIYIGSTAKNIQVRLSQHVIAWDSYKTGLNQKRISSYEIIETEEYGIELIETCSSEDRFKREQYWMDNIKCINKNSAYTGIEGNQKTKESWCAYQREHYIKNREAHLARKTRYYNQNKEKIRRKYDIVKLFQKLPYYSS